MVEENGSGVHIYLSKGKNAVVFDTYTGRRYPLYNNALGKSILSQLSRERAETIVDRSGLTSTTDNTITDRDELWQELERIREQGVAFDDEERIDGLRCVAAPVVVDDRVLGSISVSGPASRIKGELFRERLPEKVERTADIISININYQH
jgi:DNA-binding IclR family transcriptional regulator